MTESFTRATLTDGSSANGSNMSILLLQLLSMVAVFLITLAGALLPLKVIGTRATLRSRSYQRRQRSDRILSYCNCLAGGVFLATCFLGLLPSAREKFLDIYIAKGVTITYPITEAIAILGFFLILSLEQLALSLQQRWNSRGKANGIPMKKVGTTLHARDGHVRVDTAQLEDGEDEDIFARDSDTQPMLEPSEGDADTVTGARRSGRHLEWGNDSDVESGGQPHGSQGHSHLSDVNSSGLLRSLTLLFALSTHSIFEGMALGLQEDVKSTLYLLIAMLAHESLAAFALGASLIKSSVRTYTLVIYGTLFAGMIPSGIVLGLWIRASPGFGATICSAVMQAIAAGIFIFVTFFEILNHEFEVQRDRPQKIAFAALGYTILAALKAIK